MSESPVGARWAVVVAAAGVLAMIAVPTWIHLDSQPSVPSESTMAAAPTPLSSERDAESIGGEVTPETSSPVDEPSSDMSPSALPQTLSLSDAVHIESCKWPGNSGYSWREDLVTIAAEPFPFAFECLVVPDRAVSGYVDFLVPAGAKVVRVAAGQPDDASNVTGVIRFEALDAITGSTIDSNDLRIGQVANMEVPVESVVRLRLRATFLGADDEENWLGAAFSNPVFN